MAARFPRLLLLAALIMAAASVHAQSGAPRAGGPSTGRAPLFPKYDIDYIGPPMADPVLQDSKETYIVMGCAYCHGMYLQPRGEAADLMHSGLVGADVNGSTLIPLLKAGVPRTLKLSPMPQYSDLSDKQLHDLVRWIHYSRQRGRHEELTAAMLPAGDANAGKAYFTGSCTSCHATDLARVGAKYDTAGLRAAILEPKTLAALPSYARPQAGDVRLSEGRQKHNALLENYSAPQVANLMAYLSTLK
jgi:cytochrome c553